MKAWFRVALPWEGAVVAFLCLYAACYLPNLVFYLSGGKGEFSPVFPNAPALTLHWIVILFAAVVYAGLRVYAFHPAFRKDYWEWLKQTPWRVGLPLPLGPVHLVPQDVVILGILTLFGWRHFGPNWWLVPCTFLAAYVVFMMTGFIRTGLNRHAYLLAFGLGGLVWLSQDPLRLKVLLLGLYGVSFHGLRQCVKDLEDWDWPKFNQRLGISTGPQSDRLGWPFDLLGPHRHPFSVSHGWAAALALLAGWWVLGLAVRFDSGEQRDVLTFLVVFLGVFASIGRLLQYLWGYVPPINLRGRIATRQWIIPGYDVIFVAPLLGLAIVASLKWWLLDFRVPIPFALAGVTAAYAFVTLGFPPSLDEWRLTGNHRIVPTLPKHQIQQLP